MVDATISRVRLRDLARAGRFQGRESRGAGFPTLCASWAEALGPRPRAASSRPDTDDLVASTI
jgi:hypothetical protein